LSAPKTQVRFNTRELSFHHESDAIARFVLQKRELKKFTSAGGAFHENTHSELSIF
jgi:hypothetical protein